LTPKTKETKALDKLLIEVKSLAKRYRALTGRPLGVTGEVAEVSAIRALGLELAEVRQSGYDAIRRKGARVERLQIKGRCILNPKRSGRIGAIKLDHSWHAVLLVLLDEDLDLLVIYEAKRRVVEKALKKPGSKARNERGALSISQFKSMGTPIWKRRDIKP